MQKKFTDFVSLVKNFISWFFGITFIILGISEIFSKTFLGLLFIFIGLFLIPPLTQKIEILTKKSISSWEKSIIVILLFAVSIFISEIGYQEENKNYKKFQTVKNIQQKIPEKRAKTPPITKSEIPPQKIEAEKQEVVEKKSPIEATNKILPKIVPTEEKKTISKTLKENKKSIPVLKIVDGDTIDVLYKEKTERIRIQGMDTPETKDPRYPVQCFGKEATLRAKEILEGQNIYLETDGDRGKYQRLLAYIQLTDGTDYGEKMIREGYAWHYSKYPHERMEVYDEAEKFARKNNNGLWSSTTCSGEKKPAEKVKEETKKAVLEVINTPNISSSSKTNSVSDKAIPLPVLTQAETQNVYNCSGNIYNCGDFKFHNEAQKVFEYCQKIVGKDIHKLDRDNNNVACESLP